MTNHHQIDRALAPLALAYPHHFKQYDSGDMDAARALYHRILSDIDGALLEAAVTHWLSLAKPFHPSPGELRDMAYSLSDQHPSAEEAWGVVKQAMRQIGSYRTPEFDDPLIARAVEIMGWRDLCLSENDVADRAHFFRIYDSLKARAKNEALMLPDVRRGVEQLKAGPVRGLLGVLAERLRR